MQFTEVKKNLEAHGFQVTCFETAEEATAYLDAAIDGKSVGFGGSVTLQQMGIYEKLATHNLTYWHWILEDGESAAEMRKKAQDAQIYLSSVNGLAQTGELINIDGSGNRVSSILYGHEKVYFVIGVNKLAPDYEQALHRARNIAAPKNAKRLGCQTPCAAKADRCYNCSSPGRICRGLAVLWEAMIGMDMEVILINQELGY